MNKISKVYLPSIFTVGEYYILGIESDNESIVNMSNVIYTAEFVLKISVIDALKIDKYKLKYSEKLSLSVDLIYNLLFKKII